MEGYSGDGGDTAITMLVRKKGGNMWSTLPERNADLSDLEFRQLKTPIYPSKHCCACRDCDYQKNISKMYKVAHPYDIEMENAESDIPAKRALRANIHSRACDSFPKDGDKAFMKLMSLDELPPAYDESEESSSGSDSEGEGEGYGEWFSKLPSDIQKSL